MSIDNKPDVRPSLTWTKILGIGGGLVSGLASVAQEFRYGPPHHSLLLAIVAPFIAAGSAAFTGAIIGFVVDAQLGISRRNRTPTRRS